jgi:hypothetical protein
MEASNAKQSKAKKLGSKVERGSPSHTHTHSAKRQRGGRKEKDGWTDGMNPVDGRKGKEGRTDGREGKDEEGDGEEAGGGSAKVPVKVGLPLCKGLP